MFWRWFRNSLFICAAFILFIFPRSNAVKTRLTWVNGIGHNLEHVKDGESKISKLFGGKEVCACHNPTSMTREDDYVGFIGDLTQAGAHKLGKLTSEVDSLVTHLKEALEDVGEKGIVIHIAHSQGAIITSLAAKQLLPEEMSKIEIICFGGGKAISRNEFPHFKRIVNYYAVNDPILMINPNVVQALKSGFSHVSLNSLTKQEEPEFVFLSPRGGDPVLDHMLLGPTYLEALIWEGKRFQTCYQSMPTRVLWSTFLKMSVINREIERLFQVVVQVILRYTVLPYLSFAVYAYLITKKRLEQVSHVLSHYIVIPMLTILLALLDYVKDVIRYWRGEKKFEPLPA